MTGGPIVRRRLLRPGRRREDARVLVAKLSVALVLAAAIAVGSSASAVASAADSGYTLTILPTLGGCCSSALGINSAGLVVGSSQVTGNTGFNAFLWDGATLNPLPALSPGFGTASTINDAGLVAGSSSAPYDGFSIPARATLWTNGQPTELPTLQSTGSTFANRMNGAGQIVGSARLGAVNRPVFWPTPSQIAVLPDFGGVSNFASDLDDAGDAVGQAQLPNGDVHAILWTGIGGAPQLIDINPFGGSHSIAFGINANGAISGTATYPGQPIFQRHAVVWTANGTVATDIHQLPAFTTSAALDINNSGQVVGIMQNVIDVHAFLYSGGVMTDLNDLLPPGSPWTLQTAAAINDAGTIVGYALSGAEQRGFILTPNTPSGSGVVVQPIDSATSSSPVTLTFANVTAGGGTTLTIGAIGPSPPAGFSLGDPPTYYTLSTTATFTGSIAICIDFTGVSYSSLSTLRLYHYENGSWTDVTTTLDVATHTICGIASSLSPFAIFQSAHENQAPTVSAGGPYVVGEGGTVQLTGSGSDPDGDALTYAWDLDGDGTFETPGQSATFDAATIDGPALRTAMVRASDPGGLTATATATVSIDNVAPSVGAIDATAGPIVVGAPVVTSASFTDPAPADTHEAVWSWGDGTTTAGVVGASSVSGSHVYAGPGVYTIRLAVTDDDGGAGSAEVMRTVVFGICLLYDPDRAVQRGSTIPVRLELCSADGTNLSSPSITLKVVGLRLVSTSAAGQLDVSGNANQSDLFRFDATLGIGGGYVYNLETKGLASGTYALQFVAGSQPYVYEVRVRIR